MFESENAKYLSSLNVNGLSLFCFGVVVKGQIICKMGRFGIFWDNRLQVLPVGGSISLQMKPFLTSKNPAFHK